MLSARETNADSLFQIAADRTLSATEKKKRYEEMGKQFELHQKVGNAADAYSLAIKFCHDEGSTEELPDLLLKYATVATHAGRYSNAITALEEIMRLLKGQNDNIILARTYMQIGIVFFFQEKWDDALVFYQRALQIAQKGKEETGISIAYNNIANIYQKKGNTKEAYSYYNKALDIQRANGDSTSMCNSLMNIGTIIINEKKPKESYKPLREAFTIASKINNVEIQALCYAHLAYYYAWRSEYGKANEVLTIAENLARHAGYNQTRLAILDIASSIYAEYGLYSLAYECQKRSKILADSIATKQMQEKIMEFDIRFKSKEKEAEIALKNQELQLARKLHIAFTIISTLMVAIIIALIIYTARRYRQNKRLREMNDTRNKLLSIISHDIKGPAIAQKMALDTILSSSSDCDSMTRNMLSSIRNSVATELALLQNLLDWSNIQIGNLAPRFVVFNIVENIGKVINLYSISARNKGIGLHLNAPKQYLVHADQQMISTVIRNLLSNAVKFSKAGSEIHIRVEEEKAVGIKVSVSDKGIGMSKKQITDILESDNNKRSTTGTGGEIGSGLGLIICKSLLKQNKSKLCIDSKEGEGSVFSFVLASV
ncbi:histidine kinase [Porphyromonas gulae]|uniref:histidine kinase n=2 Tax=Porphyromonas gulae TaxID=111105 RepID=A0A0A2FWA4_9PORP|nr:histidine kinase [Porphyromonas gulae]